MSDRPSIAELQRAPLCTCVERGEEDMRPWLLWRTQRPSIAELQRETERWPERWMPALGEEGEWQGFWWCDTDKGDGRVSADTEEDYANEFAQRVADLANAAPVLLEIAARR